jgi:hypothetical protein
MRDHVTGQTTHQVYSHVLMIRFYKSTGLPRSFSDTAVAKNHFRDPIFAQFLAAANTSHAIPKLHGLPEVQWFLVPMSRMFIA